MAADNTSSNAANVENILSAVQNWVASQNGLTKSLSSIISSNHVNLNLSNLTATLTSILSTVAFSTTAGTGNGNGTVTTINTSVGLLGGPITISGTLSVSLTKLTNSLSGDITPLSTTSTYTDGPSVAQGSSGTWFASGSVTVEDTAGAANIFCKLWDGTTVAASGNYLVPSAASIGTVALSGFFTSPAGNIRISARDNNSVSGKMLFNFTGNSKDSTITVIRIG